MPIYDYQCSLCGLVENVWARTNEERMVHGDCGNTMKRVISSPNIAPPWFDYVEENMGHDPVHIGSRTQRDRLEKERGLYGKGGKRWV